MINFFIPVTDDFRGTVLDQAIELAKENLGKLTATWPIDTRIQTMLMYSADADEILAELRNERFTDDNSVNVFFVRKDIHTENTTFCFGATVQNNIVISDYRIWHSLTSNPLKVAMLAYLVEHEVGHAFGVADDQRAAGIYDKHCTDSACVMQQVISVEQLAEFARNNIVMHPASHPGCYCRHCQDRFYAVTKYGR